MNDNAKVIEKTQTEYKPGKLFLSKNKPLAKYVVKNEKNDFTFDFKTGNFHILPEDRDIFKSESKKYLEISKEIKRELEKKNYTIHNHYGNIYDLEKKTDYYYEDGGNLFLYVDVEIDNIHYEIQFIRFFIESEKQVNCILSCLQFICEIGKSPKSYMGYPVSEENGVWNISVSNNGALIYYNPHSTISSSIDSIITEFEEFICKIKKII